MSDFAISPDPTSSASPPPAKGSASTFSLDIVAPERQLVSREVHMVTIPGVEGDFGVLPGHAPLVAALRAGVVSVYDGAVVSERIFISGGTAEVAEDHCILLAEEAIPLGELDAAALEEDSARLLGALNDARTDDARAHALMEKQLVDLKREAVRAHSPLHA